MSFNKYSVWFCFLKFRRGVLLHSYRIPLAYYSDNFQAATPLYPVIARNSAIVKFGEKQCHVAGPNQVLQHGCATLPHTAGTAVTPSHVHACVLRVEGKKKTRPRLLLNSSGGFLISSTVLTINTRGSQSKNLTQPCRVLNMPMHSLQIFLLQIRYSDVKPWEW